MATRRQPGGSPAGLKIKLRPGPAAAKASLESQPEDSGEDVGADSGDDSGVNEGVLKRKRGSSPAPNVANKRPARGHSPIPLGANGEPVEVVPGKSERVTGDLLVVKQRVGKPHSSVGAILQAEEAVEVGDRDYEGVKKSTPSLENLSHGQLLVNSIATYDSDGTFIPGRRAGADPAGFGAGSHLMSTNVQASLPSGTPGLRTIDCATEQHTIPSHAGWFSWTQTHTLEKRGLPEFFNGKTPGKTPKLYVEYRNAIMNKYREDVKKMITVADVQEMFTALDEKTISRVLDFFDHWGLINYQAPSEFRPLWQSPALALDSNLTGMLRALPQKGSTLYEFDSVRAPVTKQGHLNRRSADVAISEILALPEGPEVEYHCNSCGGDCSKQRYHCQKQADFDLCSDCYNDGKFGPDMISADFIRIDAAEEEYAQVGGWTDQETLLLLEALEMYGDNWNEIAEHVATKSKAQCILHFIRLPVEDPFLEDMETPGTSLTFPAPPVVLQADNTAQGEQTRDEKADKTRESIAHAPNTEAAVEVLRDFQRPFVAFADAPNPVMAQVAFLAAMVGPRVAAAAAQAALATLTQKDPGPRLAASTTISMEPPKAMLPSSVQPPDRLASADYEVHSARDATQPSTAGAGSVGGTSVFRQENISPVKPNISSRPLAGSGSIFPRTDLNGKLYEPEEFLSSAHVKRAAASAMAAAAIKAKLLADQEEREMQRLVTIVIEHQLKKLELKLKTFNDLETMLSKECESVERARQKIYAERVRMVTTRLGTGSSLNPSGTLGAGQQAGQRPAGYTFGPGGHATPMHTPGAASNFQGINASGVAASPGLQALARPVTAGAMPSPQGQLMRQGMVGGPTPPLSVGRTAMPQGAGMTTPSPQQPLGRHSMPTPVQASGRPLSAPPGMSRPAPGGTSTGAPQ